MVPSAQCDTKNDLPSGWNRMRYGRRPVLIAVDHHAGLRIDHHDRIVIQVRRIDQAAIGRERDVADEILRAWASASPDIGNVRAAVRAPFAKRELEDRRRAIRRRRRRGRPWARMARPSQPSVTGTWPVTAPDAASITLIVGGR